MSEVLVWDQFARQLAQAYGEGFVRDFCKSITDELSAKAELAYASQRKVAAATAHLDNISMEGLGECHMRVDTEVYWNWVLREGRGIWNDKAFIKRFKADNPEVRVSTKPRKSTIRRP